MGTSLKKVHTYTNCKKQGHSIETCWSKGGGKEGKIAKKLSEKAYSNIWGLSRHLTNDKMLYYVLFVENYSRELVIYLMSSKDQVFMKYKL